MPRAQSCMLPYERRLYKNIESSLFNIVHLLKNATSAGAVWAAWRPECHHFHSYLFPSTGCLCESHVAPEKSYSAATTMYFGSCVADRHSQFAVKQQNLINVNYKWGKKHQSAHRNRYGTQQAWEGWRKRGEMEMNGRSSGRQWRKDKENEREPLCIMCNYLSY